MQKAAENLKNTLSPAYGLVMLFASGLGAHAYYTHTEYADIKRAIYAELFTAEKIAENPLLALKAYDDLDDVPDNGEGRYSAFLPHTQKSKLFLHHETRSLIQKNTTQTMLLSVFTIFFPLKIITKKLAGGLFFPVGTSCLLATNLFSRIMLVKQTHQSLNDDVKIENINDLLEKRREINNIYREIKDYSELAVALLIPLIASRSLFQKYAK